MQKLQRHSIVPVALFAGLTTMTAVAAGWFGLETWLLSTRKEQPITWFTRNQVSNHPATTAFVCFIVGLAAGASLTHFVADDAQ